MEEAGVRQRKMQDRNQDDCSEEERWGERFFHRSDIPLLVSAAPFAASFVSVESSTFTESSSSGATSSRPPCIGRAFWVVVFLFKGFYAELFFPVGFPIECLNHRPSVFGSLHRHERDLCGFVVLISGDSDLFDLAVFFEQFPEFFFAEFGIQVFDEDSSSHDFTSGLCWFLRPFLFNVTRFPR